MMIETPNCTPPIRPDFTRRRPFEKVAVTSIAHQFQETSVVLAHLARLFERPRALNFKAPKVALDVPDVELEVAADEIGIVPRGFRIAWHERPGRRQTGRGGDFACQARDQKYSLCHDRHAQPEGV